MVPKPGTRHPGLKENTKDNKTGTGLSHESCCRSLGLLVTGRDKNERGSDRDLQDLTRLSLTQSSSS